MCVANVKIFNFSGILNKSAKENTLENFYHYFFFSNCLLDVIRTNNSSK